MDRLWDTTFASRIRPDSSLFDYAVSESRQGRPVPIAAPSLTEMFYGIELKAVSGDRRFGALRDWLVRLIGSQVLNVISLDGRAAVIAGRLRAENPHPPPGRDSRSKTMRQAAWLFDIQIAAVAFAAGLDVATRNIRDFEVLSASLERLYPGAPTLAVYPDFR